MQLREQLQATSRKEIIESMRETLAEARELYEKQPNEENRKTYHGTLIMLYELLMIEKILDGKKG